MLLFHCLLIIIFFSVLLFPQFVSLPHCLPFFSISVPNSLCSTAYCFPTSNLTSFHCLLDWMVLYQLELPLFSSHFLTLPSTPKFHLLLSFFFLKQDHNFSQFHQFPSIPFRDGRELVLVRNLSV